MTEQEIEKGGGGNEWMPREVMETALAKGKAHHQEAQRTVEDALAPLPKLASSVAEIETLADIAIARVKAFEKVKKAILREGHHYIISCRAHPAQEKDARTGRRAPYVNHEKRPGGENCGEGQVMMKKPGADALGNGFGVSVRLLADNITPEKAVVEVEASWQGAVRFGRGTCFMSELMGEKTEHNMHEKAQTRAEKRAILAVLGSADPIADEE
jgi:hypothetical protein